MTDDAGERSGGNPEHVFFDEGDLKRLIAREPSRIEGVVSPAATAQEVAIPPMVGFADVVIVEIDGTITIVECKLLDNKESHGAAVGQALSYAAGLSGLPGYSAFKERFERGMYEGRRASLTCPFEHLEGWDNPSFSKKVGENLGSGRFRVVIATDEAPEPLKVTIAFLENLQVRGIELGFYEAIPTDETRAKPDRKVFMARIRDYSGDSVALAAKALLDWASMSGLDPDFVRHQAIVSTTKGTLFRIKRYHQIRVSIDRIEEWLERRDDELARIESDLSKLGIQRDGRKARGELSGLDTDAFLDVMQRVVDAVKR